MRLVPMLIVLAVVVIFLFYGSTETVIREGVQSGGWTCEQLLAQGAVASCPVNAPPCSVEDCNFNRCECSPDCLQKCKFAQCTFDATDIVTGDGGAGTVWGWDCSGGSEHLGRGASVRSRGTQGIMSLGSCIPKCAPGFTRQPDSKPWTCAKGGGGTLTKGSIHCSRNKGDFCQVPDLKTWGGNIVGKQYQYLGPANPQGARYTQTASACKEGDWLQTRALELGSASAQYGSHYTIGSLSETGGMTCGVSCAPGYVAASSDLDTLTKQLMGTRSGRIGGNSPGGFDTFTIYPAAQSALLPNCGADTNMIPPTLKCVKAQTPSPSPSPGASNNGDGELNGQNKITPAPFIGKFNIGNLNCRCGSRGCRCG